MTKQKQAKSNTNLSRGRSNAIFCSRNSTQNLPEIGQGDSKILPKSINLSFG